jgi:hypothetical protein
MVCAGVNVMHVSVRMMCLVLAMGWTPLSFILFRVQAVTDLDICSDIIKTEIMNMMNIFIFKRAFFASVTSVLM